MNSDEIFSVLRKNIVDVLPHLTAADLAPHSDLHDLDANSLDRIDILTATLDALGLDDPVSDFAGVTELDSLVRCLRKAGGWE